MLKDLIKLANDLDNIGDFAAADAVTEIAKRAGSGYDNKSERAEDLKNAWQQFSKVYKSLEDSGMSKEEASEMMKRMIEAGAAPGYASERDEIVEMSKGLPTSRPGVSKELSKELQDVMRQVEKESGGEYLEYGDETGITDRGPDEADIEEAQYEDDPDDDSYYYDR